jgi:hypothetical protein
MLYALRKLGIWWLFAEWVKGGVTILAYVCLAASAFVALTPSTSDDEIVGKILGYVRKIANALALNVLNATPAKSDTTTDTETK